jgi:transposase
MEKYTLKQQRVIDQIKFPKRWELYNKGFSDRKIAEELNVNKNTIYHWRKVKNKLKPKGRTKIDRDIKVYKDGSIEKQRELNKIKFPKRWELYNKGFSDEEIAKEFDMKKESVRNWRVKYKLLTKEEIEKRKKLKTYKDGSIEEIRRLDRNKFPERWELYEEGMIDREIAEELGVSYAAISQWRRKIKLKAHGKTSLSKKENKKRMKLYKEGKNDREIAKVVGVNNEAIYKWRRDRDLPSNYYRKLSEEKHKRRLEYYNMGLTDAEIGEKVGKERNTIADWRRKNNLPLNSQITLSDEEHNKRLNLYKKNMNDREIAEIREVSSVTIRMWREKNNLPLVDKASSRESNFNYNPLTHAEIDLNIFTEEDKEILKIYLEGLNDGEMGKRLEMTRYFTIKLFC